MDLGLTGKRALVTGSTAGIGFAAARALAIEGASVTVNGRTETRVSNAVTRLQRELPGANVNGFAADLSTGDGCRSLIRRLSQVDILVNNLGIFDPKPFDQILDEDWMRFFEINVLSGVRLTRHYLPGMRSRNWGRIVFVSSESALQIPAEMIHYGMTKTAQLAVARGLAETLAGTGVTVNSVLPGPTASEGVGEFVAKMAAERGSDAGDGGTGILRDRSPFLGATALHQTGRSSCDDCLRLQHAGIGDDRGGASRRRRRCARDRMSRGPVAGGQGKRVRECKGRAAELRSRPAR